jgi:glycosyltransferase involved in cell wall biosynthesis
VRVGIVNSSSEIGGAELSLLPVARELATAHDVVAFLPGSGPLHAALRASGIETRPFRLGATLARASRQYGVGRSARLGIEALAQQSRFAATLRRARLDVVYCNGFRAQLGATLPAKLARTPLVWHVRDFVPPGPAGAAFAALRRLADIVIANSQATAAQPALAGIARVIPNGIDLDRFTRRTDAPDDPPLVGMIGHLTPWKGHARFLRVLRLVGDELGAVRGAIAGDAIYDTADHRAYAAEIAASARAVGCAVDAVSPEAMPRWLERLSVLVHCPERAEPFGRALAEALALGVPVVTTAAGGAPEVVGAAGVVVHDADDAGLASAVITLLRDPDLRRAMGATGVARARRKFDERRYTEATVQAILAAARRERVTDSPRADSTS